MRKSIEIKPVCPLLGGKECISDGLTREVLWNCGVAHPCMFFDGDSVYNGVNPTEPCRLKRAVNRILIREKPDEYDGEIPNVPWSTEKKE